MTFFRVYGLNTPACVKYVLLWGFNGFTILTNDSKTNTEQMRMVVFVVVLSVPRQEENRDKRGKC